MRGYEARKLAGTSGGPASAQGSLAVSVQMWPTAATTDARGARNATSSRPEDTQHHSGETLLDAVLIENWATPQAHDQQGGSAERVGRFGTMAGGRNLADEVLIENWATPKAGNANGAGEHGDGVPDLQTQVNTWPTPRSRDHKGGMDSHDNTDQRNLADTAEHGLWQTPATDSFRSRGGDRKDEPGLDRQAKNEASLCLGLLGETSDPSGRTSAPTIRRSPLRLNPTFVEWLQGFPRGWSVPFVGTDSDASATPSFRPRRSSRSARCSSEVGGS